MYSIGTSGFWAPLENPFTRDNQGIRQYLDPRGRFSRTPYPSTHTPISSFEPKRFCFERFSNFLKNRANSQSFYECPAHLQYTNIYHVLVQILEISSEMTYALLYSWS